LLAHAIRSGALPVINRPHYREPSEFALVGLWLQAQKRVGNVGQALSRASCSGYRRSHRQERMEIFKVIVDLLKALAWPGAVFGLGFMFRSDVRALFPRLKKAGPTGFEFDPARQVLAAVTRELQELPGFPARTPMITKVETELHAELGIIDPEKKIDVLVRHLAVARLARNFEQVYRVIFGSQIAGLTALAAAPNGDAPASEASTFFDTIKAKFPEFYEKAISSNGYSTQSTQA
jgi:hypothetical protein